MLVFVVTRKDSNNFIIQYNQHSAMIDPHVHCRDGKQAYKETIEHVFEIAKDQGIEKIFDMPNTDPPITHEKNVQERLKLVPDKYKQDYYLYIGVTNNISQLEEAVKCYNNYKEIIGLKLYAGKSVGDLGVIEPDKQITIYKTLAKLNYTSVLAVHCEKDSLLQPKLWNPQKAITHCYARPPEAEIESVREQIEFAKQSNFKGTLHICHVSCPESVDLIETVRGEIKITCGATPHHLMWTQEIMNQNYGLMYKVNPPLRDMNRVAKLRQKLIDGKIDWIETDHAPHRVIEKIASPYLSGYTSLYWHNYLTNKFLPEINMPLTKKQIEDLTYNNIYKTFKEKLDA